jgi:hypothetical protein
MSPTVESKISTPQAADGPIGGNDNKESQCNCEICDKSFASRNAVFKHLRDPSSSCGRSIVQSQERLEPPPSTVRKEERRLEYLKKRRRKTGKTFEHCDHCLWIGDLPLAWTRQGGNYRRLRALLHAYLGPPLEIRQPWIKKVQRKAYRTRLEYRDDDGIATLTHGSGVYLGYAIVAFRDEQECELVSKELDGKEITIANVFVQGDLEANLDYASFAASDTPPFRIKVRPAEKTGAGTNGVDKSAAGASSTPSPGLDPPLEDQLRPLVTVELIERIQRRLNMSISNLTTRCDSDGQAHILALEHAVGAYSEMQRPEVHHKGRLIPTDLRDSLLNILKMLRWAVPNHRTGLTAERYLVLPSGGNDPFYADLREACRALMDWTDTEYYYSGIAVTKNFVSSPHIDELDRTFQYAVSLGDFTAGGELCIDGILATSTSNTDDEEVIHVVDTHDRIARVDGRHVHWVRTWEGGDRYSLIFYDTSDRHPTPIIKSGVVAREDW